MKLALSWLFAIGTLIMMSHSTFAQTASAMTYNIRYDNPGDGENNWHNRKARLLGEVLFHEPDVAL